MSASHETLIAALLANTFTVTTALRRIAVLRQAIEIVLYQDTATDKAEMYRHTLGTLTTPEEAQAIINWGSDWVAALTVESWQTVEKKLEDWVSTVPRMTLYVPVVFDLENEALVGLWSREHLQAEGLLDLKVDPNTVGGCALVRDGHYIDLSLAAKLNEQPQLIPTILQSYDT